MLYFEECVNERAGDVWVGVTVSVFTVYTVQHIYSIISCNRGCGAPSITLHTTYTCPKASEIWIWPCTVPEMTKHVRQTDGGKHNSHAGKTCPFYLDEVSKLLKERKAWKSEPAKNWLEEK